MFAVAFFGAEDLREEQMSDRGISLCAACIRRQVTMEKPHPRTARLRDVSTLPFDLSRRRLVPQCQSKSRAHNCDVDSK